MAVYKEEKTGTWRVTYRYTDWKGERRQSQKRGFKTKRETQAWEREQLSKAALDLEMMFSSFVEQYTLDIQTRIEANTWQTKEHITKLKWVIEGGMSGQKSIHNGLRVLRENCPEDTVVMIHDGNRPMIDNDIISDSQSVYKKRGSAVAAIPCSEAIFKSENGDESKEAIPREMLFRTQTPHTYSLKKALWGYDQAKEKGMLLRNRKSS